MKNEQNRELVVIGQRVRDQRTALELSQRKLGEMVGVTGIMVGAVERGETKLPPRQAGVWSTVLKVPARLLMTEEDWSDDGLRAMALLATLAPEQRAGVLTLLESMQPTTR